MSALIALACVTETPREGAGPAEYEQALATARTNPDQGIAKLEALKQADPDGPLADEIALSLAQLYTAKRDDARAAAALDAGLKAQPAGNRSDEIRLQLAKLESKRGRKDTAYQVLAPARLQNLTVPQRREALKLLAELARARKDHVSEIVWLSRARAEAPDDDSVALVDVEIDEHLGDLSRPELEQVAEKLRGAVPAGRVRIREAELATQMSQLDAASKALAQAAALPLTKADAARLSKAEAQLVRKGGKLSREPASATAGATKAGVAEAQPARTDAAADTPTTVGVVLPLTGRFAKFGEESLNGILLAAGVFEENPPPGTAQLRLVVRDSGADSDAASAAVTELAADPTVTAVLGPLLAEESENAATAAEGASLPLLTLSAKEGSPTQHVFRFGATARAEADALAEYTIKSMGLKRFGVLYPEDPYGRGLRDLFEQAVQARGGSVVRAVGYEPRARELTAEVREVLGPPGKSGSAPAIDALFVPDSKNEGALAAQALLAAGAGSVRVLGTRGWQSPDLLRLGGTAIEGAIFTEPFDPGSSSPTVTDFSRRYHISYGRTPDVMAAQAYDAARVLLSALPPGTTSRVELEERLRRVRGYPGASGTITLQEDGSVQKTPSLRGVRSGRIVELQ